MNKKEHFIKLISTLPEEKVASVLDIVADELIPSQMNEKASQARSKATLTNPPDFWCSNRFMTAMSALLQIQP